MRINPISPDIRAAKRKSVNDKALLNWTSYQPSCIDGSWHQIDDGHGSPRNIPCHVRRLKRGSGMGHKPMFSVVAMTQAQHEIQSLHGEAACLNAYHPIKRDWTDVEAQEWFEKQADLNASRFKTQR